MVQIKEIIDYVSSRADSWEIYSRNNRITTTDLVNNRLDFISSGRINGIGVRVSQGKKVGFSYTDNISDYRRCVDEALKICRLSNPDPGFVSFAQPGKSRKVKTFDESLLDFTEDDVASYFGSFVSNLKEVSKDIDAGSAQYKRVISEKSIMNSEGVDFTESYAHNSMYFESLKLTGKETVTLSVGEAENKPLDPARATEYGKSLLALRGKRDTRTEKMQLLLHPEAMAEILFGFLNSAVTADNIQQKRSVFLDRLGAQVFDRKISITDNALLHGGYHSRSCDDEGTPSSEIDVIDKGVLKNYLYDTYTAYREGKKSTGNAFRNEFSPPQVGTTNLVISPGKKDSLLPLVDKGIFVKDLMGVHTMNMNTGDFSLGVYEGHYIENGEIRFPVKDTMISGNFIALMNNIQEIGKRAMHTFNHGTGGVYAPEVLFPEIQVIGGK